VPLVGGDRSGSGRSTSTSRAAALGAEVEMGPAGITARASRPARRADRPALPERGRDRDGAAGPRCWPRARPCCGTPPPNLRWSSSRCSCSGWARQIELSPDRRIVIRGVPRLRGAVDPAGRRPARGFSYLVAGLINPGRGPGARCPQDPAGHRDHHAGPDGRPVRHPPTSGINRVRAGRAAAGRGAHRHPIPGS